MQINIGLPIAAYQKKYRYNAPNHAFCLNCNPNHFAR